MKKIISFFMIFLTVSFGWSAITLGQLREKLNYPAPPSVKKAVGAKKHHQPVVENSTEYVIIDLPAPDAQESPSVDMEGAGCDVKPARGNLRIGEVPSSLNSPLPTLPVMVEAEEQEEANEPPVVSEETVETVESIQYVEETAMAVTPARLDSSRLAEAEIQSSSEDSTQTSEEEWVEAQPITAQTTLTPVAHKKSGKHGPPDEYEFNAGIGGWTNKGAVGDWAYAEIMKWASINETDQYYGIGLYGMAGSGDSKESSYDWAELGIGFQAGYKHAWREPDDRYYQLRQFQIKARLICEFLSGDNPDSGYSMDQHDIRVGVYTEYVQEMSPRWEMILTAEGWTDIWSEIDSSWSGDSPSDRTIISLGIYAQYYLDKNWAVRFGGGPFWTGWDDVFGVSGKIEFRYRNRIIFGPNFSRGHFTTWGGFIRIEAGSFIRGIDEQNRIREIKKAEVPSKFDKEF